VSMRKRQVSLKVEKMNGDGGIELILCKVRLIRKGGIVNLREEMGVGVVWGRG